MTHQINMLEIEVNGDHRGVGVESGPRELVVMSEQVVLEFVHHCVIP
jgi:hypothetical protein